MKFNSNSISFKIFLRIWMVLLVGQIVYGIAYYNGVKKQVFKRLESMRDLDIHLVDVEKDAFKGAGKEFNEGNLKELAGILKEDTKGEWIVFKKGENAYMFLTASSNKLGRHRNWFEDKPYSVSLKSNGHAWRFDKKSGSFELAVKEGPFLFVEVKKTNVNRELTDVNIQSVLISLILLIVMAVVSMWYIDMSISPVTVVANAIKDVAQGEGDLTRHVDVNSNDEVGELAKWFNTFIDKQREMIANIADNLEKLLDQIRRITEKSLDVKEGNNEQRDHVNRVATAVEEMSSTVNEIAMNAEAASSKSREATDKAKQGAAIVQSTIEKMNSISSTVGAASITINSLGEKGAQIGEIIGVIDDIADQTNLLALNAAIEAARAGEHGRGFAVVADEVRKLAERTSRATKEVADTIKTIQKETTLAVEEMERSKKEVEEGKDMAQDSGNALSEIEEATNTVTIMVSQIADATKEQSKATEEITQSIEGITLLANRVTEASNETNRIADRLSSLADEIKGLVSRFKLS